MAVLLRVTAQTDTLPVKRRLESLGNRGKARCIHPLHVVRIQKSLIIFMGVGICNIAFLELHNSNNSMKSSKLDLERLHSEK